MRWSVVARGLAPRLALCLGLGLGVGGCSACEGSSHTVPFGLDTGVAPERGDETDVGAAPARPAGRAFPAGTLRVDLEGAPIAVEGDVRALWAHDVDGDGDRDGVVLASGPPDAPVRVLFAQRDGSTFRAPAVLGRSPAAPADCAIAEASLAPLGARWLLARATLACPESPAASREEIFVLSADRTPRLLEHLATLSAEGRAPGALALALSVTDQDDDGHEDLIVRLTVDGADDDAIELPWLDRPSGLARQAAQPEETFETRSRAALRLLRSQRDAALASSRGVVRLHEVLCREPGRARLRVGETEGLGCGVSEGAGRAATTVVRALAAQGDLLSALDALEHLSVSGLAINDERRDYARRAIQDAPAQADVALREGPEHGAPEWESAHLSALAFLDETHLVLRGPSPRVWDLETGAVEPLEAAAAELRLLDPSGQLAVAGVERRCAGYVLRVVQASGLLAGRVFGSTHSSPLLEARQPPNGAPCPDLTPALRRDDGGWTILGWAPQGVLAARGATLRVVPLDLSGQAAGDPEELSQGTPSPAPLGRGAATADGGFHVELRGLGVVLHRVTPSADARLLWPAGWGERAGEPSDPAVSPSGRRVAVLRGGRVLVLSRDAQ